MIIDKLDVMGIALTEFEADTPSLMAAAPSMNVPQDSVSEARSMSRLRCVARDAR